jgi:hypothetical protein
LHPGQYGGRSGRDAKILVFIEELKTEICYATRKSLINFDNDAASCYDRIIPALASLIGRKFGMHRNVIFVHATTLEETKYKLKTSMGVSDEFYTNCQAFPIYGTGQGSELPCHLVHRKLSPICMPRRKRPWGILLYA